MPKIKPARIIIPQARKGAFRHDELGMTALKIIATKAGGYGFRKIRVVRAQKHGAELGVKVSGELGKKLKSHLVASRADVIKLAAISLIWPELGDRLYDHIIKHEFRHVRVLQSPRLKGAIMRAHKKGVGQFYLASEILTHLPVLERKAGLGRFYLPRKKYLESIYFDLMNDVLLQVIGVRGSSSIIAKVQKPLIKAQLDACMNAEYSYLTPETRNLLQRSVFKGLDKFYDKTKTLGIEILAKDKKTLGLKYFA